jgi:hypothetical protein
MSARSIVIGGILGQDPAQLCFPKHDHVVETFPADGADGNWRARPCYIWLRAFGGVKTLEQVKEGTPVKLTGWLAPPERGALTSLRRMLRREGETPSARSELRD